MPKETDHADEFVLVNIKEAEGIQSSEGVAKPLVFGRNKKRLHSHEEQDEDS